MRAEQQTQSPFENPSYRQPPSLLGRIVAGLLSIGLLVLGFMFSLAALAVVAVLGLALGGWIWWKTRALRKAMREQAAAGIVIEPEGRVIDGEVVREAPTATGERLLPRN